MRRTRDCLSVPIHQELARNMDRPQSRLILESGSSTSLLPPSRWLVKIRPRTSKHIFEGTSNVPSRFYRSILSFLRVAIYWQRSLSALSSYLRSTDPLDPGCRHPRSTPHSQLLPTHSSLNDGDAQSQGHHPLPSHQETCDT